MINLFLVCDKINCTISEKGFDTDTANEDVAWDETTKACVSKLRTTCFQYKEDLYAFYKYAPFTHL